MMSASSSCGPRSMLLTPSIFLIVRRTAKLHEAQLSPSTGMITFESAAAAFALSGMLLAALAGEGMHIIKAAAATNITKRFFIGVSPEFGPLEPFAVSAEDLGSVLHRVGEREQRAPAVVLFLPPPTRLLRGEERHLVAAAALDDDDTRRLGADDPLSVHDHAQRCSVVTRDCLHHGGLLAQHLRDAQRVDGAAPEDGFSTLDRDDDAGGDVGEWPRDRDQLAGRRAQDPAFGRLAACLHLVQQPICLGLRQFHALGELFRRWRAAELDPCLKMPSRIACRYRVASCWSSASGQSWPGRRGHCGAVTARCLPLLPEAFALVTPLLEEGAALASVAPIERPANAPTITRPIGL